MLPDKLVEEFDELVQHYPERRAALIPALHRCQEELGGWISPEIMEDCAKVVLEGQQVASERLDALNFSFRYPDLASALAAATS